MIKYQTVSMIGLGYIGLPTATIIASKGVKVIGIDISQHAVDTINRGQIHIVEPDLDMLVHEVVEKGLLVAQTIPSEADAHLIAVPTPFKDGHKPDLSYISAVAHSIAPFLKKGNLIILESTSPVGSTEQLAAWLAEARPDLSFPQQAGEDADIQIAYCPERVLPGHVLKELVENDRIVGGMTVKAAQMAADLYRLFVKGECLLTDCRTAEMAKLTENSFRDVNIAFANELSLICAKLAINPWELIKLANRHPRVNILNPGPGVGGHCIAVDPWFIVDSAPEEARIIRTAREVNDHKPFYIIEQVEAAASKFKQPVVACLGLAFKANIDDLRESPAVQIVTELAGRNIGRILVAEPHVSSLPKRLEGKVELLEASAAVDQADIVLLLVDHEYFNCITPKQLQRCILIDTRGFWSK